MKTDSHNRFSFAAWLFLRCLALIYVIAFFSFWKQAPGLIGPHGLLPAQAFLDNVHAQLGAKAWLELPTLCWWTGAGNSLTALSIVGLILSALLFAGIAPALSLIGLWVCYLSLCGVGQVFYGYQWDALLLETTLLAVLLAPWTLLPLWKPIEPPRLALLLLWWLLFRLMILSGAAKLTSGDPTWRDLSALTFHYETQPLPTPVAWFAHQLPAWVQHICTIIMFAIELLIPFCLFAPRFFRHGGALLIVMFMGAIALTGNYTFFNLLTAALCILWLDDAWWEHIRKMWAGCPHPAAAPSTSNISNSDSTPCGVRAPHPQLSSAVRHVGAWPLRVIATFVIAYTTLISIPELSRSPRLYRMRQPLDAIVQPFRSLNTYGLFAVMTNPRPELGIEGSDDGHDWKAYELPHKPGALKRAPTWIAPLQPRLDWQLWFAALEPLEQNPWVLSLCEHLLRGTPDVLALFSGNPFPNHPPRFIRVVRYEYHFTDRATRARNGEWWRRTPLDYYVPPTSLR